MSFVTNFGAPSLGILITRNAFAISIAEQSLFAVSDTAKSSQVASTKITIIHDYKRDSYLRYSE